jgi:hypothetical protein
MPSRRKPTDFECSLLSNVFGFCACLNSMNGCCVEQIVHKELLSCSADSTPSVFREQRDPNFGRREVTDRAPSHPARCVSVLERDRKVRGSLLAEEAVFGPPSL